MHTIGGSSLQPRTNITLLNSCSLKVDGEPIEKVPSGFYRISAVLALNGGTISRSRLADLFWADAQDGAAATNLRQSLARIRQLQQGLQFDFITMDVSRVWLKLTQDVGCDLVSLQNTLRNSYDSSALELCRLYSGDLLSDLPPVSGEFEDWLDTHSSDLRNRVVEAIGRAMAADTSLTSAQRSSCAMQILAIDPYNEEAHRQLMIEAARRGEASLVHNYFSRCREQLLRELGISPSAQTQELYQRLQRQLVM